MPSERQVVTVEQLEALAADAQEPERPSKPPPSRVQSSNASAVDRARSYVATILGAISGQGGHNATFHVACVSVIDFGLSESDAMVVMREYNERCEPPWSEKELQHKVSEAAKQPGERGRLLNAPFERPHTARTPNYTAPTNGDGHQHDGHQVQKHELAERLAAVPQLESTYTFAPLRSADFFKRDYRPQWLVKRMLVKNQPALLAGIKKGLKTTFAVDLALSLASCRPFLGKFDVYHRQRVALLSGESGEHALQQIGLRVAEAKRIDPELTDILWDFELPQLANVLHLDALCAGLADNKVDVVIIDPIYLCLLAGPAAQGLDAANLFHMGPLFRQVARRILEVGTTPILLHHALKHIEPGEPLDLDQLAYAGVAEFARQWILINRREPYDASRPGSHRLWMSVGGSEGQCGQWGVDVEEGELGDDFQGRKWDVAVWTAGEAREADGETKVNAKEAARAQAIKEDGTEILNYLDDQDRDRQGLTRQRIREGLALSGDRVGRAIQPLIDGHVVEECSVMVPSGKGERPVPGVRRPPLRAGTERTRTNPDDEPGHGRPDADY
jgi:replicative DNA helicase